MKIFKELKKLGYKHYTEHTVEELDAFELNNSHRIMEQALVLRWFRDKYDLHSYIEGAYPWFRFYINSKYDRCQGHKNLLLDEAEFECLKKLIEIVKNNRKKQITTWINKRQITTWINKRQLKY
jgi:hypothetical protein